jgi:surface protein
MSFMLSAPVYVGGDLSGWDTSRVETMMGMFQMATTFKGYGLWAWDVSNVRDFGRTFSECHSMDTDLSAWNTSSAVLMDAMFLEAISFAGDLTPWDTSRVEDMSFMVRCIVIIVQSFQARCSNLNGNLPPFLAHQFSMAESFNGDLSTWDVASVANMTGMFSGAASFNQNLCSWQQVVAVNTSVDEMFKSTACIHKSDPLRSGTYGASFCAYCNGIS